jgi:hypothetical protein
MNRLGLAGILATLALLLPSRSAGAQEQPPPPPVGSRGHAFELGAGAGFAQVWTPASAGPAGRMLGTGVGGALALDLGYRATPALALGVWGEGAELGGTVAQPVASSLYAAAAGIGGTWHFRPSAPDVDPWLAVGTGWRGQWFGYRGAGTYSEHGLELARARVGVDVRVSPSVAIGPVAGGSLDLFLTQELPGGSWIRATSAPTAASVFAGVHGTFDTPLEQKRPAAP